MTQLLDALPVQQTQRLLCSYQNLTPRIQVVRIENIPNWSFERVVFPSDRLMFEAVPEAILEIHTGAAVSSILSDRIPCQELCVREL